MRFLKEKAGRAGAMRRVYPLVSRSLLLASLALAGVWLFNWRSSLKSDGKGPQFDTALAPTSDPELGKDVIYAHGPGPRTISTSEGGVSPAAQSRLDPERFPIDRDAFNYVLDRTSGIPQRAYFNLVNVAAQASLPDLKSHAKSESEITYLNLWTHPADHRGELVTLTGHLRGAIAFDVTEERSINEPEKRTLYQCDLFTTAAHPLPYVLIVTDLPNGMPKGRNIVEDVTFAGFFLKQWRYTSAGLVQRSAPLLIGRIVEWKKGADPAVAAEQRSHVTLGVAIGAIAVLALAWRFARGPSAEPSLPPAQGDERSRLAALAEAEGIESGAPVIGPPPTVGDAAGEAPSARPTGDERSRGGS
ncbi:MAG TPA: hypothetical protein VGE52_13120 [Pirellulales bacterium]